MQITDPVADMLTRIRNANSAKHDTVDVPASNLKKAIAQILLDEGYIKAFQITDEGVQGNIHITLKYVGKKEKVISGLRRVSKPGLRVYAGAEELPKVLKGLGIAIISTSKGVMTDKKARELHVGGEVLAFVWYGGSSMSRIGKHPIPVPAEVSVSIEAGNVVTVKGPKGTLTQTFHPDMIIKQEGGAVIVNRPDDEHLHKSLHGLTRTLLNNMIVGVEKGYSKDLDIVGVGYKAEKKGNQLVMSLGFSHPVIVDEIPGITIEVPAANKVIIRGIDKQVVGQFAAEVRGKRPPEPYKGKGVRYSTEVIHLKAGKTGGKK